MILSKVADTLWGQKARVSYLLIASVVLLFTLLDARDIWTQEHRWADIVSGMFYRHDFLHPYLGENNYYDKPLLSYWFIALIAFIRGELTVWALRLPSALAGLLAIWATYRLGSSLKNKSLGLLSGWLLLTTFYFVFWARTSSADMLNLAGSVFAVTWYFQKRDTAQFFDYVVFFLIIAITSLCKGLVGAIVPLIAITTDMLLQASWKRHLRLTLLMALIPALLLYFLPFWASSHFGAETYGQSGLYLVYRENILRYFHPFDHQGPVYTYFIYLPLYLLPWAIFFIPALWTLPSRWKKLSPSSAWLSLTLVMLFLFFTVSGSRRSYYILPVIPFAILFTADWLLSDVIPSPRRLIGLAGMVILSFILLFVTLDILPAWYYSQVGARQFAVILKKEAVSVKPWKDWNVVMLDAESKVSFYLQLPQAIRNYSIKGRYEQKNLTDLVKSWPILENKPANTIFITRRFYATLLKPYFSGYRLVELPSISLPLGKKQNVDIPVAFIPLS